LQSLSDRARVVLQNVASGSWPQNLQGREKNFDFQIGGGRVDSTAGDFPMTTTKSPRYRRGLKPKAICKNNNSSKAMLSIPETARLLGHCRSAILELIDKGQLTARADERGRRWVSTAEIEAFKRRRIEDLKRRLALRLGVAK
jgi:hypothetical protein